MKSNPRVTHRLAGGVLAAIGLLCLATSALFD